MIKTNWTKIYKNYKGLWVLLESPKEPKVIASGRTLQTVMKKANKKGIKAPYVAQIPQKVLPMIGSL